MTLISSVMVLYAHYNKLNYCVVKWKSFHLLWNLVYVVCVGVHC